MTRTLPSLLALIAFATAGCDVALVSFPGDRGGRADLAALGLEVPQAPSDIDGSDRANHFDVDFTVDPGEVRPNGSNGELPTLPPDNEQGCAPVVRQSAWCASLRDSPGAGVAVTFIGLDDGATCAPVTASIAGSVSDVGSLALQGTRLAWCDPSSVVHEVDLATGAVVTTSNPSLACEGLTSAAGGFAMLPEGQGRDITWYARIDEMLEPEAGVSWPFRPAANLIAADSAIVYTALQTTDNIRRWQRDGSELEPLVLDDSPLIRGMDAAPDNRLVLLDGQRDLAVYDRITGAQIDTIALEGAFSGLACFPEP